MRQPLLGLVLALSTIGIGVACSATAGPGTNSNDDPNFGDDDSVGGTDADFGDDEDPGGGADSGELTADPETCAQAADFRSYVGCDFWPTVLANPVFVEFDFAVVVANGGKEASTVTVTGPAGFSREVSVAPGALETVLLPWVPELKGPEFDMPNTPNGRLQTSLAKKQGAYHLVSSTPVTVWQFSPLQYKKPAGTGEGQCGARITAALAGGSECRA
ncbi:MAG TPA: hypothetical protein VLC09_11340, partial [Polyangiaceae bacterium]|nr:hypothetical protein [Polyangiaceae bacterium]